MMKPDEGCSVNYIRLGFHNYTNTKTYKFMFHIIHSIGFTYVKKIDKKTKNVINLHTSSITFDNSTKY